MSPIPILSSVPACRAWRQAAFDQKKSVGFVPTMGALHDGHLSLVRRSLQENDLTIVSIFVNPAQFAPHEDLGAYPRTLSADVDQLTGQQVTVSGDTRTPSAVFFPTVQDMYPSGIPQDVSLQTGTIVEVKGHSHQMEGATRPHFFRGVATIVVKLFHLVQPTNVYFGQKDIQQALLLRRMTRDLLFAHPDSDHVHIVSTERDPVDGLALSSRNVYLSGEERSVANTLYRALQAAESGWLAGETKDACIRAAEVLVTGAVRGAASRGIDMKLDYIQMNDSDTFEILDDQSQRESRGGGAVLLSGAVWVGSTRLIDNIVVGDLGYAVQRMKLSTGTLPTPLERLAASHPFIEQIDVVFPSTVQGQAFTSLSTTYLTAEFSLTELYTYAASLAIPTVSVPGMSSHPSALQAVPIQNDADETWCIDPRGVLTLSVSKTLYEQLGIVGKKHAFKPERYVIQVPLKRDTTGMEARQRAALAIWDRAREAAGLGRWRVAYVGAAVSDLKTHAVHDVAPETHHQTDVYVPRVGVLTPVEEPEMDEARLEALFEWVGMACLGAQRLCANDRVEPYVAVYEPPAPSSIGDVTHVRWRGLMDSPFVQSVIEMAMSILASSSGDENAFIAITLHANRVTPVSYIPESLEKKVPARVPGLEAEDTVCVILSKLLDRSTWAIGQSIGRWDTRWG